MNAMMLVQRCKQKLQSVRDDDFDDLLREVSIFCGNNDIDVPNMDDLFVPQGRSSVKLRKSQTTIIITWTYFLLSLISN